jgi:hypothetical protein
LNSLNNTLKTGIGIGLIIFTVTLSFILAYLEYLDDRAESEHEKNRIQCAEKCITGCLVFMGTYALMINYFVGLNQNIYTQWLFILAILVAACSSMSQAFVINQHPNDEDQPSMKFIVLRWLGKFFMNLEIILYAANTAFSNNTSSLEKCLNLLNVDWISERIHTIGLFLFIVFIVTLGIDTYQSFKPIWTQIPSHMALESHPSCGASS